MGAPLRLVAVFVIGVIVIGCSPSATAPTTASTDKIQPLVARHPNGRRRTGERVAVTLTQSGSSFVAGYTCSSLACLSPTATVIGSSVRATIAFPIFGSASITGTVAGNQLTGSPTAPLGDAGRFSLTKHEVAICRMDAGV
jgi:hypothetical protein